MLSEIRIEVNKKCNLACDHCYTDKRGELLSIHHFERTVREAHELGARSLSITGGEPLLELERTVALIRQASDLGMRARLNTNGWYAAANVLQELKQAGLDELQVSMSHHEHEEFDRFVHRKGSYFRALSAVCNGAHLGMHTTIRFTLMHNNFDALVPLYEIGAGLGIKAFKVRSIVEVNGVRDEGVDCGLDAGQRVIDLLGNSADRCGVPISIADDGRYDLGKSDFVTRLNCKCGVLAVFVSADGIVSPCPFLREDERQWCGSILDGSLGSIVKTSRVLADFVGVRESDNCGNDAGCRCKANIVAGKTGRRLVPRFFRSTFN